MKEYELNVFLSKSKMKYSGRLKIEPEEEKIFKKIHS